MSAEGQNALGGIPKRKRKLEPKVESESELYRLVGGCRQ